MYLIRVSQRSRLTFSTPPSTSPTARQILCTPTSELLSPSDTGSNRKPLSTLPSGSTVAVLPRGEQLLTQEHYPHYKSHYFEFNTLLLRSYYSMMRIILFHIFRITFFFFFSEPEVGTLERIQLLCTAQSTRPDKHNRHCIYSLIFLSFIPKTLFKSIR